MPRYCPVCGRTRPTSCFYHSSPICTDCSRLPQAKQVEMQVVTRINDLIRPLSSSQRDWLEKLASDPRESVRSAAREALEET